MADEVRSFSDVKATLIKRPTQEAAQAADPVSKRDAQGRSYATGRRKNAVARVWIKPGAGKVTVNSREESVYFARAVLRMILRQPLVVTGRETQFDVVATVVLC